MTLSSLNFFPMIIVDRSKLAERVPDIGVRSAITRAVEHANIEELNEYLLQNRMAVHVPVGHIHDELPPNNPEEGDE